MSLHIIIDGYNLIRRSSSLRAAEREELQHGRETLLQRLVRYRRIKPHRITVVFDGMGAPCGAQRRDRVAGIAVIFSGPGESADQVIGRLAVADGERALVVSSDGEVARSARSARASVIGAAEFEERLAQADATADDRGEDYAEAEGWRPTTRKRGPGRRAPKRERLDRRRLAKL